ncbi:E3 ubiquitin-protein ligase RGLG2-like [Castanea sativa]|uniref:E3 ubiquitin-protein ligase RGLG2-like n=1 Tax=Castanea sativa TaxID=21020 RepID=UPI003F65200F
MGGKSSKDGSLSQTSSIRSTGSSSNAWGGLYQSPFDQESQNYAPPQQSYTQEYYAPAQDYGSQNYGVGAENFDHIRRLDRRYSRIADNFKSLEQVTEALARAGLESSNLIVGIDFTKSNEWTGAKSFQKRSLHHIGGGLNPYEQAISIIGKTLSAFDEDNLIPCFGFGDASTHDRDVFSFYPDGRFCNGFEEVLRRYREIVPKLRLAGPTSFAPVIEMAMTIVEQSGGQYHVLVIIADGQVTRSVDTEHGKLSPQEQKTVDAIVEASKFPLSIILVGVGDGPWDMMKEFDDNIPAREFDNFQFVNFTEIMSKNVAPSRKETEFALTALMEIPSQYKATIELNILGGQKGTSPGRVPLPTPIYGTTSSSSSSSLKPSYSSSSYEPTLIYGTTSSSSLKPPYSSSSYAPSVPPYHEDINPMSTAPPVSTTPPVSTAPPVSNSTYEYQLCPICLSNVKNMAYGCGHQTCCDCGEDLEICPICRRKIETRIRLY